MIKTIFKELIITILLCIAILLVLSVIFYDYNPMNKIIPNKIASYSTPENIKEEINANVTELETTNIVYRIESSDLNMYIKTNSYIQGKANPFAVTSANTTNAIDTNTNVEDVNTNNGGTSNGNSANSDGTFWNSAGKK